MCVDKVFTADFGVAVDQQILSRKTKIGKVRLSIRPIRNTAKTNHLH